MRATAFDPLASLLRLTAGGLVEILPRSAESWRAINTAQGERVVGFSQPRRGEDLHPQVWEMHPEGDELLHLVEGAIDLVLDAPEGEQRIALSGGQSCVVARGAWHRLLLREPSILMFITPAGGTRMRPYAKAPDA
ncbi:hypothetical protein [Caulobacter sp. CCH9-E1]|jgi:mannose-6-phosphate isomerase-like protein (cupin superfamily)|uniref:cupin domain-containing protein n=1 Tax=Caulobacter sp. CCH9-E1 TaxID=1768768 RepID=UPI000831FDE3|nr:hypothetical protein [Caulobacter sp. CCH9-E1]